MIKNKFTIALTFFLVAISVVAFFVFYQNGLGLAYNDARSHLDISRRVVEGLKPGLAQLGSVWLPLPHMLMVFTVWNDWMWHSGLAGGIVSMVSFVACGLLIVKILQKLDVSKVGQALAIAVFVLNINILYLQSTAMTELLLLATMTAAVFYLICYAKEENNVDIIKSAFFAMLASLVRYDGWFLLLVIAGILVLLNFKKGNFKKIEGILVLFGTLAFAGVFAWFLWNFLIFKDPLYFAFGPFSAHAQQDQLNSAGVLLTKGNLLLSIKIYIYALFYNSYSFNVILALIGSIYLFVTKSLTLRVKIAVLALFAPLAFNVLALYLGHSVLFIQGISGNTWFNVRYGIMLMPSIAIFIAYLADKARDFRYVIIGLALLTCVIGLVNFDAVTIDDATVGSSQKNVSEVSGYLKNNAADKEGFVLISAASHDAIIFSSGMPMKRFIHEGTGAYWTAATTSPDRWARWIVVRTYDNNDLTWKKIKNSKALKKYNLVAKYPFADVYALKNQYVKNLNTKPIFEGLK